MASDLPSADEIASEGAALLARLDRLTVWPYPWTVLAVTGAGFFFSFFDIVTIGFALPAITKQFGVSAELASWSITSGLVGYILGAFLDSRIGDRYGRRISLYLSVAAFSLGSVLSATSSGLGELVFWRFVSGMGIGAEIALVTTYMAELSPAPLRGRYTGWTIVCAFAGFALVPLLALHLVPEYAWGWRALFVAGGLGGLLIGVMRRGLPASGRWLVAQGRIEEARAVVEGAEALARKRSSAPLAEPAVASAAPVVPDAGIRRLFRGASRGRLVLLGILWFAYYVGNYAWLTLAADLFSKHGLSLSQSIASLSITGFGFVAGALAAVYLSDRLDRRRTVAGVCLVWAGTLLVIGLDPTPMMIEVMGFVASCTIGLVIPLLYTITGESFPTSVRATGVSLTDGFGHLGGAFCGQIVFGVEAVFGFTGAFAAMALTGLAAAVLVGFATRNTGQSLESLEREA